MLCQSLSPQLKFTVLHNSDFEFVSITSINDGSACLVKQVGSFMIQSKLKLSQIFVNGWHLSFRKHVIVQVTNAN